MSELTRCNFCTLLWMRRNAAKSGKVVTLVYLDESAGIDVLVHDEGEKPDRKKHRKAWFGGLSETCCC